MTSILAERVARVALDHFHHHPALASSSRGKPGDSEWTVYAALVASSCYCCCCGGNDDDGDGLRPPHGQSIPRPSVVVQNTHNHAPSPPPPHNPNEELWVVSCGTGTKCTARRKNGWILHDTHAEVLARRGLMYVLWNEIKSRCTTASSSNVVLSRHSLLEEIPGHTHPLQFRLRQCISLHLYISDSPCGDASIYDIIPKKPDHTASPNTLSTSTPITSMPRFTGSKLLVVPDDQSSISIASAQDKEATPAKIIIIAEDKGSSNANATGSCGGYGGRLVREPGAQALGKLRSKSSHSNCMSSSAIRTTSMSCSDKLCRWQVQGWQGRLLYRYIPDPVRVSIVAVSADPQAEAASSSLKKQQNQYSALQRALVDRCLTTMYILKEANNNNYNPPSTTNDDVSLSSFRKLLCDAWDKNANADGFFSVHVIKEIFPKGMCQAQNSTAAPFVDAVPSGSAIRKRKNGGMGNPHEPTATAAAAAAVSSTTGTSCCCSPCGLCLNWNMSEPESVEVLAGARGIRQGKKPRTDEALQHLQSRLCRAKFVQLFWSTIMMADTHRTTGSSTHLIVKAGTTTTNMVDSVVKKDEETVDTASSSSSSSSRSSTTYQAFKAYHSPAGYDCVQTLLFRGKGPLVGWLTSPQDDNFCISRHQ